MKDFLPKLHVNVSQAERGFSLLAGAYLLYDALGKEKKSGLEAVLAGYLLFRGASGNCAAYDAIGKTKPDNRSRNVNNRISQVVNKPRNIVYKFWRDFENLPLFMEHLNNVTSLKDGNSLWEAKIPGGIGTITWKSEIVKERPNELLGWRSLPDSPLNSWGKIEFKDDLDGLGTEVKVVISYHAPGGIAGEGAARFFNPVFKEMLEEDVANFKWFIERGY